MGEPSGRREPKRFEPPPWERDQFEQLEKKRSEHEAPTTDAEGTPGGEGQPTETGERPQGTARHESGPAPEAELDPVMLDEMMFQLRAEEPSATSGLWKVGLAAAAVMLAVGAVMMVWGIVALRTTKGAGATGTMGASILLLFGGVFVAITVWTAIRSYRQRGVV